LSRIFSELSPNPEALTDEGRQFLNSIQQLKSRTLTPGIPANSDPTFPSQIQSGSSSTVKLSLDPKSNLIAVKTVKHRDYTELIRRETAILKELEHPLVIALRHDISSNSAVVTEFVGNGSLASYFRSHSGLSRANRIAKIIAGVALAMRFLHRRDVVHRDLTPENILLDWDWTVKIADFGGSVSRDEQAVPCQASINSRYRAPECYDGTFLFASDVFAFGLILFELLTGRPVFPENLPWPKIAYLVAVGNAECERLNH
jgi:serine/threonine protein kinase